MDSTSGNVFSGWIFGVILAERDRKNSVKKIEKNA